MLHRFRPVLVRPGRSVWLESWRSTRPSSAAWNRGWLGGRARGKKVLTGIAVEIHEPEGMGRCRMLPLADASAHVEPGARVITDGWQGYRGLEKLGYVHDRRSQRAAGDPPGLGEGDSPRQLPERVRLPVQPPPLSQPLIRHRVSPHTPTAFGSGAVGPDEGATGPAEPRSPTGVARVA